MFAARYVYPDAAELPEFFGREELAVIEGRSKLIVQQRPAAPPTRALYDLLADPRERVDASAAQRGRADELQRALDAFLEAQRAARAAFLRAHPDAAADAQASAARSRPPAQDALERLRSLGYLK